MLRSQNQYIYYLCMNIYFRSQMTMLRNLRRGWYSSQQVDNTLPCTPGHFQSSRGQAWRSHDIVLKSRLGIPFELSRLQRYNRQKRSIRIKWISFYWGLFLFQLNEMCILLLVALGVCFAKELSRDVVVNMWINRLATVSQSRHGSDIVRAL